jgi:hypothetical protein
MGCPIEMLHREIKEVVQINEKSISPSVFSPNLLGLFVQTDKEASQGNQ